MLFHGDCLEVMKTLDDESIDLVFCDLPYGQTSCKWDCKIDLQEFWEQIMRIKKLNTPIFFTTTAKFGVELIQSAPKKCFFRYDLVWVKSSCSGFLRAKTSPLRKHELVYVFYEKLPFYDLSGHKHRFQKTEPEPEPEPEEEPPWKKETQSKSGDHYGDVYRKNKPTKFQPNKYDPPLPTSVVDYNSVYNNTNKKSTPTTKHPVKGKTTGQPRYEPPLPDSILEIKSTRGSHSTEKPVALMEWVLKYYSKEGDVVLDPTMGSGSTGVACKNLNRQFIGIELDPEIFEVASQRLG